MKTRSLPTLAALVFLSVSTAGSGPLLTAPEGVVRPSGAKGTVVVPDKLLRRWDPITVFFNGDVGPARLGPEDDPDRYVTLVPDHPGAWSWLNGSTLQFRPADPFPPLTRFEVRVQGRTTVLATLMEAPVAVSPGDGANGLDPVNAVSLVFTEPVELSALGRMITLELRPLPGIEEGSARVLSERDFSVKAVERAAASDRAEYIVNLKDPVPLGVRVVLKLRLTVEDDPARSFAQYSFSTMEPFRLTAAGTRNARLPLTEKGSRYPREQALRGESRDRGLVLDFNSPLEEAGPLASRNLVRLDPPVDGLTFGAEGNALVVRGGFEWDTVYRVVLSPTPLKDSKGRVLEMQGESEFFLFFPSPPPQMRWVTGQGIVERYGPKMMPMEGSGQDRVDLRIHRVDPQDLAWWPFPEAPVAVDERPRPPGPGEEPSPASDGFPGAQSLRERLRTLGSPPVSVLVDLPRSRRASTFGLNLDEHLAVVSGKDAPGHYLVGVRNPKDPGTRAWSRIQVTDLCLTIWEEIGSVVFFVTSIRTGQPVPGAQVRVEGVQNGSQRVVFEDGRTDVEGRLLWAPNPATMRNASVCRLVVSLEDDILVIDPSAPADVFADGRWTKKREAWIGWLGSGSYGFRGPQPETLTHIFTDRPIYRPDEEVHVKGYIRSRHRGRLTPVSFSGTLVVNGPGGKQWRYPLQVSERGSFSGSFKEDKLGTGLYYAHVEDAKKTAYGRVSFSLEAYRLPEFQVLLSADEKVPMDRPFAVTMTAAYYAGGRAAGRPTQWRVTQFPYTWIPEKREGYLFSSDGRYSRAGRFESSPTLQRQDVTDEQGAATITIDPSAEPTAQPRSYVVEATVTGADDQTVTATRSVIALPAFVLGVKVPRYIEKTDKVEPSILVVGPDGRNVDGLPLTVRLMKREWHSILRESDFTEGTARYQTDVVDRKVQEKSVTSGKEPVTVRFSLPEAGVYVIEVEAKDRLQRSQVIGVDFFAAGEEPVAWPKPVAGVFTVSTDKDKYVPGDTATLVLNSPFQTARALAVVEGPEGNSYSWMDVRNGAAVFTLPVKGVYAPRIPVHFLLMRGRTAAPAEGAVTDVGRPATVGATVWLDVAPVDNRAEVSLEYPPKAFPGQEITVKVRLQDPSGKPLPGEVTLWLVDQAVLALAQEQPLDPLPAFITNVRSWLLARDTRNLVFGYLPYLQSPGGDGLAEPSAAPAPMAQKALLDRATVRRLFLTVPYFNPGIEVGADGMAQVTFRLPDNLTNFKLRAKAVSGAERFGFATGHLEVRLPVIVQPALPRFVRPGDAFSAAVVGRVVEGEGGAGKVEFAAEGVAIDGPARKDVTLEFNRPERVEFPIKIPQPPLDAEGKLARAEVSIKAAVERLSDAASDAFEVKLPLKDDRDRVTRRTLIDLAPKVPVDLPEAGEAARPGSLRRMAVVSTQPGVVRMAAGLDFLLDYPYGCTEQIVSRARAQLGFAKFRSMLRMPDNKVALDREVRKVLDAIPTVIDPGGNVSYWPGSPGYVSLTAWVVQFMVEARAAGYPVEQKVYDRLVLSLQGALRSDYTRFIDGEAYTERCMALTALAAAGKLDVAYATELARKTQYLNLEGKAQILGALAAGGDRDSAVAMGLGDELWQGVVFRLYQGREIYGGLNENFSVRSGLILPGETRTLAQMTRALLNTGGGMEKQQLLVNALVTLGKGDGWGNTNANAEALLALAQALDPKAGGRGRRAVDVDADGKRSTLTLEPQSPVSSFASSTAGRIVVTMAEDGEGEVVLRAETSYIPAADGSRVDPQAQGFVVRREEILISAAGGPDERLPLEKAGTQLAWSTADVVEEHVQVVNPERRNFVAVVVPLAAGMEPLNPKLLTAPPEARTSGRITQEATYSAYMDDQVAFYYDTLPKGTYDFYFRVRATIPGRFIQPAAKAEMMYNASVRGNSAGAIVQISRKKD